jgi:hypothetical protein
MLGTETCVTEGGLACSRLPRQASSGTDAKVYS